MTPREELELLRQRQGAATPQETYDPTEGMEPWQKVAAGAGKAIVDTGRGIGQLLGMVPQEEIDAAKQRDAALMDTGLGLTGNIIGNVGMALAPGGAFKGVAALLPWGRAALGVTGQALLAPKTVLGASALGAGQGFVQPVASDDSRVANTALGAAGGALPQAAIATGRTVKALVDPWIASGRERIAGDVLRRFAGDKTANVLAANTTPLVPGTRPDLAEVVSNGTPDDVTGMGYLKQLLLNHPDTQEAVNARMLQNQEVRKQFVRNLSGQPGEREALVQAREGGAQALYRNAFEENPKLTPWVKGELTKLQKRPAFEQAWREAKTVAANRGIELGDAVDNNVVQYTHFAKIALDDMIDKAKRNGGDVAGLMDTKRKLVALVESKDFAPSYRMARETYARDSAPINKIDTGAVLEDALLPAFEQFGARRITPQKFASAVANIDQTAQKATGFAGAKGSQIYSPQEMSAIENVVRDLARSANSLDTRVGGSPTSKYILGQDVLEQITGPLGIPKSWATSALAENFLSKPMSFIAGLPQDKLTAKLAEVMLDPETAKRLLQEALRRQQGTTFDRALPYASPLMLGLVNSAQ